MGADAADGGVAAAERRFYIEVTRAGWSQLINLMMTLEWCARLGRSLKLGATLVVLSRGWRTDLALFAALQ